MHTSITFSAFFLFLLTMALMDVGLCQQKTNITCEALRFGNTAHITCSYGGKFQINKHSFFMEYYPSDDPTNSVPYLSCDWTENGTEHCVSYCDRYTFSDTWVIVQINTNQRMDGQYACHLYPPDHTHSTPCAEVELENAPPAERENESLAEVTTESNERETMDVTSCDPKVAVFAAFFVISVVFNIILVVMLVMDYTLKAAEHYIRVRTPSA